MLARLIFVLLLALGAVPAAAMPATCHADPATGAMTMTVADPGSRHRSRHAPAPADHVCLGCVALRDADAARIARPTLAPAASPAGAPARLLPGTLPPPTPRPPRLV